LGRDREVRNTLNIVEVERIQLDIRSGWSEKIETEAAIDNLSPEAVDKARDKVLIGGWYEIWYTSV